MQEPTSGLAIDPPAGFSVRTASHRSNDAAFDIVSDSGKPASSNVDGVLCKLAYKSAPQNAALTRDGVNAMTASAERQNQVKSILGRVFRLEKTAVFTHQGYSALEFQAFPRFGPNAENAAVLLSIVETVKGRTTFVCTTTRAELQSALGVFRKIRNSVNVPR